MHQYWLIILVQFVWYPSKYYHSSTIPDTNNEQTNNFFFYPILPHRRTHSVPTFKTRLHLDTVCFQVIKRQIKSQKNALSSSSANTEPKPQRVLLGHLGLQNSANSRPLAVVTLSCCHSTRLKSTKHHRNHSQNFIHLSQESYYCFIIMQQGKNESSLHGPVECNV